jgi:release factor glutamine methyltransferase
MTILELYHDICRRLEDAGIPDCDSEAVILIGHLLHFNRGEIFLNAKQPVQQSVVLAVEEALATRINLRSPLAYIIAEQDFWSRTFKVSPDVLIPRPETEILIEKVLETLPPNPPQSAKLKIMDLGTGSGVIAVTLSLELENSVVLAVDRSLPALKVARTNAALHGVLDRVSFLNADWQSAVKPGEKFDLVVSNPPYVARDVLEELQPELDHEPALALDGGSAGVEEIDRIAAKLHEILRPGGWFFMEIGFDQEDYVLDLFSSRAGLYQQVMVHKDYAGLPRILQAQLGVR